MSGSLIVYIAPKGFEKELLFELRALGIAVLEQRERLFLCKRAADLNAQMIPAWAQNIWFEPEFIPAPSINHVVKSLRARQRNWACHPTMYFRRSLLIQEKLPKLKDNIPWEFGTPLPEIPPSRRLGAWTLWREDMVLASPVCSSCFADGELLFRENKQDPPGRAYLKLWEALTLLGKFPGAGDIALDLGSSPGGWTWVLASLGAGVVSVDKAPLAENVAAMPGVEYMRGSAFGLCPHDFGQINWLCSDVICYPERLFRLIMQWLDAGYSGNIICTLKFQGATDFDCVNRFRNIPGGKLIHLFHNKHELTWLRPEFP